MEEEEIVAVDSWEEIQSVKKNESVAKRWYSTGKEVEKK